MAAALLAQEGKRGTRSAQRSEHVGLELVLQLLVSHEASFYKDWADRIVRLEPA